jgi:hypothetical protein
MAYDRGVGRNPYAAPEAPLGEARAERPPWYQISLTELVVVIAILGVLIGFLVPAVTASRSQRLGRAAHRLKPGSTVSAEPGRPIKNGGPTNGRAGR